jgi:hypothetical protein
MPTSGDEFDSNEVHSDITRIRAKLKRLDDERKAAVEALDKAMKRAERTIARRTDETPSGGGG